MVDTILIFAIQWLPTVIWTLFCLTGIYFGFKEVTECNLDMDIIEKDKNSFKFIVAQSNRLNAFRSIGVQFVFLAAAAMTTYFKLQEVQGSPDSYLRALLVPALFIFAEYLLISNLKQLNSMRASIKKKVDNRKALSQKEQDKDI